MTRPPTTRSFDRSIVEGPILDSVWKLAWPTMLQNMIAGFQGMIDHALVGHFVGFAGNAAIGVSWQIFLVVVVFMSSIFTGMGILVARFAGADEPEKVNRTVAQALVTAVVIACGILAPFGFLLAPQLLDLVNAAPAVKAEALPYLRTMFLFSIGNLLFFMLSGALRAAGDAKTPLRMALGLTFMNVALSAILIPGLGPVPALGTLGAAVGTVISAGTVSAVGLWLLVDGRLVIRLGPGSGARWRPDWKVVAALFRFGLPTGFQGIAMNVGGVLLLRFIGSLPSSAAAQAAYTVSYTQLFSLVTWTSVGLMGATAAVAGQNLGADRPDRTLRAVTTSAGVGAALAATIGLAFYFAPRALLSIFGLEDRIVLDLGAQLLRFLSISGLFVSVALAFTGGLQGCGDTKSPLAISIVSQVIVPLGMCWLLQETKGLEATDIWAAIVLGHVTRAVLSVLRFRQGAWAEIRVEI